MNISFVPELGVYGRCPASIDISTLGDKLGAALRAGYAFELSRNGLDAIRLLLLSGCRRQEIQGLRLEEVDFDGQCLKLADIKTGPQSRPIGKAALDVIRDRDGQRP